MHRRKRIKNTSHMSERHIGFLYVEKTVVFSEKM